MFKSKTTTPATAYEMFEKDYNVTDYGNSKFMPARNINSIKKL